MTATLRGVIHEGRLRSIQSGERRYVRVFAVTSDTIDEDVSLVEAAVGVSYLDSYSYTGTDSGALAENFTTELAGNNPYLWHVTIEYTSRSMNPAEWNEDPLQRRWRLKISSEKFKKPAPRDIYGKCKRNSAGELIEGLERDDSRQVLEWELNTDASFVDTIFSFKDTVNASEWQGKAAGTLKVDDIRMEPMYENGTEYYHVWIRFHHDPDGWVIPVYDRGFHWLNSGNKTRFVDNRGTPTPEPQFLDGGGGKLTDAVSTLSAAIPDAAVTTAYITSVTPFTNVPRPFYILIDDEVLKVHNVATGQFTVSRGRQGTTAAAHTNGSSVTLEPVELGFVDYEPAEFSGLQIA